MESLLKNRFLTPLRVHAPLIGLILIYPWLIVASVIYLLLKWFKPKKLNYENLRNQVAVITGSARGLGREIANELAKHGCHIAIVDIQRSLAEETAASLTERYSIKAKSYVIDVANYQQLQELEQKVTNDLGTPTILINNAGILMFSTAENPPPEEISLMINVNLTAMCYTSQIFLPKMKELNRGHIVNISSLSALMAFPNFAIYASTKTAMRLLTSMLRMELMYLDRNITATTVMPAFMNTNKNVEKLLRLGGLMSELSIFDGDKAAQMIVESMLRGDEELIIPGSYVLIYKLFEMLPTFIKEKFLVLLTSRSYHGFVRSSRVKSILEEEVQRQENTLKDLTNNNK